MRFKHQGFPNEGEITICTVKRIQRTTVFVTLDEYENRDGIIHISEISPGRIRTIRDFVKEGKKIVCKVLRKNERYGNLDLSLRRVTTGQRLNKIKELKLEEKCEKIIDSVAKQLKIDGDKLYDLVRTKVMESYETIGFGFQQVAEGETNLASLGIDKKSADALESVIKTRLKPQEVKVLREFQLTCPTKDGIEVIKKSLQKGEMFAKKQSYDAQVSYISAPRYSVTLTTAEPKKAEEQTNEIIDVIREEIEKGEGTLDVQKGKK